MDNFLLLKIGFAGIRSRSEDEPLTEVDITVLLGGWEGCRADA